MVSVIDYRLKGYFLVVKVIVLCVVVYKEFFVRKLRINQKLLKFDVGFFLEGGN